MAKVVLTSRCSWTLYNFRWDLIKELQRSGYNVGGSGAGGDGYEQSVEKLGVPFTSLPIDKKTTNPILDAKLLASLTRWYRRAKPAIVHNFTIKPVIYGSIAARPSGVPVILSTVNTVPGPGHGFTPGVPAWPTPLVEILYRFSPLHASITIFLNNDDRQLSIDRTLIADRRSAIVPEWVDAEHYRPGAEGPDDADRYDRSARSARRLLSSWCWRACFEKKAWTRYLRRRAA